MNPAPAPAFPRRRPPIGLCVSVVYDHVRDGDTVVVRVPFLGDRTVAVRLLQCWAPERGQPGAAAATEFVQHVMDHCDEPLVLQIPQQKGADSLFDYTTFDRWLAHIWVSHDTTLSEMIVNAGHATAAKQRKGGT